MSRVSRREFGSIALVLGAQAKNLRGATGIDETLRSGIERRKIPCVTAMVATADKTTYSGAFGTRDAASGVKVQADSIFAIASMTKAVTSVAAMQLLEQGKLTLDEPASKHLPVLGKLEVLEGFDKKTGKAILRPATKPVTLRQLLTHTSGFAYDTWHDGIFKYATQKGNVGDRTSTTPMPLAFEPGTRWQYGYSVDWTGRLVEAVSGLSLEEYFQRNILKPLGMKDTSFLLPAEKFDRLVSRYQKHPDGSLTQEARKPPAAPPWFNGSGGLNSTAPDYIRFMQIILRQGKGSNKEQILQAKTVEMMASNQIGDLDAGKLKTARPDVSSNVDFHPGFKDKFGFGFLINTTAYDGGRSAGSLAWAGVANTFYWIDPRRGMCAVIMMQFLPFCDTEAMGMLRDFERAVYSTLSR
jgi:CubicO group peptidase (beta-lactamase class C family)